MTKSSFRSKLKEFSNITSPQYWQFKGIMNILDLKKIVTLTLEEEAHVECGHCGSYKYSKHGRRNDFQRYKCKNCGKTFNILTGTPLARLRKKGRWLDYSDCLAQGLSVRESARLTGVSKKTSFKWRHTFLENANLLKAEKLNGIVEVKETKFKYSEKGAKVIRHPEKFGTDVFVLTSLDRNRLTSTPKIWDLEVENIEEHNANLYSNDCIFISEEGEVLKNFIGGHKLIHKKGNVDSVNSYKHIKNVKNYNDNLHLWMKRFKGVATKYLQNYLSWYRELDEFLMQVPIKVMLVRAKSIDRFPYNPIVKLEEQ
jgi:transposase-like protein